MCMRCFAEATEMLSRGRLGEVGRGEAAVRGEPPVPLFGEAGRVDVGAGGELMAWGGGTGGRGGVGTGGVVLGCGTVVQASAVDGLAAY